MSQHIFLRVILGACLFFCMREWAIAASIPPATVAGVADVADAAEKDKVQIRKTLLDYIDGTANGEPDRLRNAFHPDFKLYAASEDGKLLVRSGNDYINNIKPGEKTNRLGRILSIDLEHNAATAKVEIVLPGFRIYTDFFLLIKYRGSWKIMQKSYTWKEIANKAMKILFVTSNQHTYGNTRINTANHFEEIVVAYDVFKKNGYTVDFVSPDGGAIPLGYIETSNPTQKQHLYDAEFMNLLKHTLSPGQVDPRDYQAVYYSGGGAAMFGIAENKTIQSIVSKIYENGGVISAVCHGTAGIVNLKNGNGISIFSGKKITGFPDIFEDTQAEYYKSFPFSIGKEIVKNGGDFVYSKEWGADFYIVDGNIITGQDPSSTASVANKVIEATRKIK